MMKILIDNGADVNVANSAGKSPLLLCVECGSIQGVKHLLEKKATITDAARELAVQKGNKEIEKLLTTTGESK
jgi:ankyrin repeat protein